MYKYFVLIAVLSLSACSKPTPHEELSRTFKQMISAINNNDKRLLLDKYIAAKGVTEHDMKAKQMRRFKLALEKANVLGADIKTTATITIEGERRPMIFIKLGDQWKFLK